MHARSLILVAVAGFFFASKTLANPLMVYKQGLPIALVGLEDALDGDGCDSHLGFFVVDNIAREGTNNVVVGIRGKAISGPTGTPKGNAISYLIKIDYDKLNYEERKKIGDLVKKGDRLLVTFNECGNDEVKTARDIYNAKYMRW